MRAMICGLATLLLMGCADAPTMISSTPFPTADAVLARSRDVFEAERTGDRRALESLLSNDYVYLSSVGNADRKKDEEIALQIQVRVESYSIEKARAINLGPGTVALHYFAHQQLLRRGERICPYSGAMEVWRVERGALRMLTRTEWLVGSIRAPSCR